MPAGEAAFVSLADLLRARPGAHAPVVQSTVDALRTVHVSHAEPIFAKPAYTEPAPADRTFHAADLRDDTQAGVPPMSEALARMDSVQAAASGDPHSRTSALREARLFRAALADAFDARLAELVRAFAAEILGRELCLEAADLASIARRLIAERLADEPLRLRVAPADAQVACELPVAVDSRLEPGDAVLECRSGDIDARLHTRLEHVLAEPER